MGTETVLFSTLVVIGTILLCVLSANRTVYAAGQGPGSRVLLRTLLVLPIFVLGFYLVAMRPMDAGNDTARYLRTYSQLDGVMSSVALGARYFGNTELLWWPLQSLLKHFFSERSWLAINYILVFGFVALYYRKATAPLRIAPEVFALVFLTFFLVYSGNVMRQALAAPIGALGFHLALQRRFTAAAALIAASIGLHWSCIVFAAAPIMLLRIFDRSAIYFILPPTALAFSALSTTIIGDLVSALNIPGISQKFELYFLSGHESHVGLVWKTANFWICSASSLVFLLICRPSQYEDKSLHKYTLLFFTLVLFGINTADFSERYIPLLLMVTPLHTIMVVDALKLPSAIKNALVFGSSLALGTLILLTESSQYTLGYSL